MADKTIRLVKVEARFPGGRVVSGLTRQLPQRDDKPFQIWFQEGGSDSVLINPSLAETVEFKIEYEVR